MVVEREKARRDFVSAEYWDLRARFQVPAGLFQADLVEVEGKRVALGRDFDENTGKLHGKSDVMWIDGKAAGELAVAAKAAKPYIVESLTEKEAQQKPQPPFMTTTLQQDANRKFSFGSDRTMRIAQTLYEGVELGGETVGLISYMRTDSLTLSDDALRAKT